MNRRRFIALIGAAVPGLWLDGTGLIQLPKRMVIAISGQCSFCGKTAGQVFGLAGVTGRSTRVCNECIDICLEILRDDLLYGPLPSPPPHHAPSMFGYPEDDLHTPPPPPSPPPVGQFMRMEVLEAFDFELIGVTGNARPPQTRAELEAFIEEARKLLDQSETVRPRRDDELSCSFCDRKQDETRKLIAGPRVSICDVCIGDAAALISMHS